MSYDIEVWCADAVALDEVLPSAKGWAWEDDLRVTGGRSWQVLVEAPRPVMPEDVPDAVADQIVGVGWLVGLTMEPIGAPSAGRNTLFGAARAIARASHGAIVDDSEGTVETPRGVRRLERLPRADRFTALRMTWFLPRDRLATRTDLARFFDVLARDLREAMPRRFGLSEPPELRYDDVGHDGCVEFFDEHRAETVLVWWPNAPLVHANLELGAGRAGAALGFVVNGFEIVVDHAVLTQPGWGRHLPQAWRAVSAVLRPFYGEARVLRNAVRWGAQDLGIEDEASDLPPIHFPQWRGLPRTPALAAVLGDPYLDLWPEFADGADRLDGLAVRSADDWSRPGDPAIPSAPERLSQPFDGRGREGTFTTPTGMGPYRTWRYEYPTDHAVIWPFTEEA